jgi:ankyrin repeat protein
MRASRVFSFAGIGLACFLSGQNVQAASRSSPTKNALLLAPILPKDDLLNQRLIEAVKANDKDQVANLLESSADPNSMYRYCKRVGVDDYQPAKIPLLFLALGWRDININCVYEIIINRSRTAETGREILRLLLDAGCDVNQNDPLAFAVKRCDTDVVKSLLDHGAKLRTVPGDYPYLVQSAHCLKVDTVHLLLKRRVDVNESGKNKEAALIAVANISDLLPLSEKEEAVQVKIATTLLRHGAAVNAKDADGMTALMYAVRFRYVPLVKALLQGRAKVHDVNAKRETVLQQANGFAPLVSLLRNAGAKR